MRQKNAGSFGLVFVGDEFWVNRGSSRTRFEGPFRLSQPPSERPFYGVPAEDFFFAHDEQCLQNVAASNTFDGFSHWSIEQDFGHLSHYRLRYDRELSRSAYFFSSWRCGIDFFNLPPSEGVVPLIEFLATAIENEQCLPLVLYDF